MMARSTAWMLVVAVAIAAGGCDQGRAGPDGGGGDASPDGGGGDAAADGSTDARADGDAPVTDSGPDAGDGGDAGSDAAADGGADADVDGASGVERALLVGNSYVGANDLRSIVEGLFDAAGGDSSVHAVAPGGYRLDQHADDADGTNGDTRLRDLLVTGEEAGLGWDVVVLQQQSQIPGFPTTEPVWIDMEEGGRVLRDLAADRGATTVLFMTWGYRDGDSRNPGMYPDYATMQDRIAPGYTELASRLSTPPHRVVVAPVGEAFRAIHLSGDEAAFRELYAADGSHPSLQGSYLAACVFLATLTGTSPVGIGWAPASLSDEDRDRLQGVADTVVLAPDAPPLWRL